MSDTLPIVFGAAGLVIAVFAFAILITTIYNIERGMQNIEKYLDRILAEIGKVAD